MRLIFILIMTISLCNCQPKKPDLAVIIPENFDWQGHRGARGLLPENTIPAFLKALEFPIRTLELDVVISKDSQVVISHEPWLSHTICSKPDSTPVTEKEEQSLKIFQLTYAEIKKYDCGSRGNVRFPSQQPMQVYKPLLKDMITAVENYCKEKNRTLPFYNIEIKSMPEWDSVFTPAINVFAQLLIDQIKSLNIQQRTCIQSFDVRALQAVRQIDSTIVTALLVENTDGLETNLEKLGFIPNIYSPYYQLISANMVKMTRERGMRIIPWTVNDTITMQGLIKLGVDGIITDYPNYIESINK